jgi:hypothetical protein
MMRILFSSEQLMHKLEIETKIRRWHIKRDSNFRTNEFTESTKKKKEVTPSTSKKQTPVSSVSHTSKDSLGN